MAMPPEILYHYTNMAGLKGIIESRALWLTNLFYLNDNLEHFWLRNKAHRHLQEKRIVHGPNEVETLLGAGLAKREMSNVCCASFSKWQDLLSQWRAYADDGAGVSIGFASSQVVSHEDVRLCEVIYDEERQSQIIARHIADIGDAPNDDVGALGSAMICMLNLWQDAAICKNPAFKEEGEWRLVRSGDPASYPEFRTRGSLLVPYYTMVYSEEQFAKAIKQVWLGPRGASAEQEWAVGYLLKKHNLGGVDVYKSSASYRS